MRTQNRFQSPAILLAIFLVFLVTSCEGDKDENKPVVATYEVTAIGSTEALCGGVITSDGGFAVTIRGACWSTEPTPTIDDNKTSDGSGTGAFTSTLTNLSPGTTYYLRAYATNSVGTAYGGQLSFSTFLYFTNVTNPTTGEIWMDRNLGASKVARSTIDAAAYGDLYQWGRGPDGHERTSGTTSTLATSDIPGHGNFIITSWLSPYDWRSTQNDNLWQGVSGTNNPCPSGYRLPTDSEWEAERRSWSSDNAYGAFTSSLKLPVAGYRAFTNGSLNDVGSHGSYWSSMVDGIYAGFLDFDSSSARMNSSYRANGFSVRCIKDRNFD